MNSDSKQEWDFGSTNKAYLLEEIKDEISISFNDRVDLETREKAFKVNN